MRSSRSEFHFRKLFARGKRAFSRAIGARLTGLGGIAFGFLLLGAGCASVPREGNSAILALAVARVGLPTEIRGFVPAQARLRPDSLTFHFLREDPPGEFWVIRFAESPTEQKPQELESLDGIIATVRAGKNAFELGKEETISFGEEGGVRGFRYRWREEGKQYHGFLCLWRVQVGEGAWIFVFNINAPEAPAQEELKEILSALGAPGS